MTDPSGLGSPSTADRECVHISVVRRRNRKKRRLGEFREMGFEVRFRVNDSVSNDDLESWSDTFLVEAIEDNRLLCGGGCGREWNAFVTLDGRGSATERHQATVEQWLPARRDVDGIEIGPLVDAWYGV